MEEVKKIRLEVHGERCTKILFFPEFYKTGIILAKFDPLSYHRGAHRGRGYVTSYRR